MIRDIMYELARSSVSGGWCGLRARCSKSHTAEGRLRETRTVEHPRVLDVFSSPQPFSEKNMGKCYVSMYSIPTGERCPDVSRT